MKSVAGGRSRGVIQLLLLAYNPRLAYPEVHIRVDLLLLGEPKELVKGLVAPRSRLTIGLGGLEQRNLRRFIEDTLLKEGWRRV